MQHWKLVYGRVGTLLLSIYSEWESLYGEASEAVEKKIDEKMRETVFHQSRFVRNLRRHSLLYFKPKFEFKDKLFKI